MLSSWYISSNVRCGAYSSEHSRQVIPYDFMKEDYIECECLVTLLLYIFRYTVALATMVFIVFMLLQRIFKTYFRFFRVCIMLYFWQIFREQNNVSSKPFWWWLPFLYLHSVPVINLASLPVNYTKLNSSFLLSSTSPGFLMHLIHFIAHSRVIPDTSWFLSPHTKTITNVCHFCFLNMYQINPLVSTWHHLSIYCSLPIFTPLSELLKCKSDHSHCPEDI